MRIQYHLSPSPRLRQHWWLALFIVLLVSMTSPRPVHAAPTWMNVASLNSAHSYHTATLLPNGKILVAGGYAGSFLRSVEVYDPIANTWTPVASLNSARAYHTATLLSSGKVLVVGGHNGTSEITSTEVYDPNANTWTNVASLNSGMCQGVLRQVRQAGS
jgi:Kelch motif